MKSIEKESFLLLLKFKPQLQIGKQIIYDDETVNILDVSIGGDYLLLEDPGIRIRWVSTSKLGDRVVIDTNNPAENNRSSDIFTVKLITTQIETLEKHVGQPGSEQSKSLFDIVAALNKELLELRLKIENKDKGENHG